MCWLSSIYSKMSLKSLSTVLPSLLEGQCSPKQTSSLFMLSIKKKDFYLREAIRSRYLAFEYMLLCTVPGLGLASALLLLNHYWARASELSVCRMKLCRITFSCLVSSCYHCRIGRVASHTGCQVWRVWTGERLLMPCMHIHWGIGSSSQNIICKRRLSYQM